MKTSLAMIIMLSILCLSLTSQNKYQKKKSS